MTTWIILFRGVGGATLLPVKPLAIALTEEGFEGVRTYINTGNVVLKSSDTSERVLKRITPIVLKEFDFSKAILIASTAEWAKLIADNPFPNAVCEPTKLHAYLMEREPDEVAIKALQSKAEGPDEFQIRGRVLYYYTPQGISNARLFPKIERTLGVVATARNWNTVLKLQALAEVA
ncbi:uncharacterized protein (DUF1697 family) [Phyllobacterium ifriqiyense]|uniref:Uncharacterized protein (DUF1697 family) n=1 Tax=Phyllobacterium ifriqiyense TaxID=314238 RepID=A0ABU0SF36_9HYPH|nr:DUF1697 domain-containing protein [Phyllobacterium ifriqiyense]MDQ0999345.1 uncharacterized protein (DUF1697 family) [Phyllobacterium ifriqiyense]